MLIILQLAVAAAIGVGGGGGTGDDMDGVNAPGPMSNSLNNRLQNKMKGGMLQPNFNPALGEINRSIEKMSIGVVPEGSGPSDLVAPCHRGMVATNPPSVGGQTAITSYGQRRSIPSSTQPLMANPNGPNHRRGSDWTNSTEGYGSMRSEQSITGSRRCSEISAMSQVCN